MPDDQLEIHIRTTYEGGKPGSAPGSGSGTPGAPGQPPKPHDDQEHLTWIGKLTEKLHEMEHAYTQAGGGAMGFLEVLGSGVLKLAAWGAALFGVAEATKKAIEAGAEMESHMARLDAALASQGVLTDEYRKHLHELAEELQNSTGKSTEQWFNVFKRLTQAGADSSNIDKYAIAVKNLAGYMENDIEAASSTFRRALEGNFMGLSRLGIKIDETASQTEKMDQLMRVLPSRGGQQLEHELTTLSGHWQMFKLQVHDATAAIGSHIVQSGILQNTLSLGSGFFKELAKAVGLATPPTNDLINAQKHEADMLDRLKAAQEAYEKAVRDTASAEAELSARIQRTNELLADQLKHLRELHQGQIEIQAAKIDLAESQGANKVAIEKQRYDLERIKAVNKANEEAIEIQNRRTAAEQQWNKQYVATESAGKKVDDLRKTGAKPEDIKKAEIEYQKQKDALETERNNLKATNVRLNSDIEALKAEYAQQLQLAELKYKRALAGISHDDYNHGSRPPPLDLHEDPFRPPPTDSSVPAFPPEPRFKTKPVPQAPVPGKDNGGLFAPSTEQIVAEVGKVFGIWLSKGGREAGGEWAQFMNKLNGVSGKTATNTGEIIGAVTDVTETVNAQSQAIKALNRKIEEAKSVAANLPR